MSINYNIFKVNNNIYFQIKFTCIDNLNNLIYIGYFKDIKTFIIYHHTLLNLYKTHIDIFSFCDKKPKPISYHLKIYSTNFILILVFLLNLFYFEDVYSHYC